MDYLQDQLASLLANGSVSPSTVKNLYSYTSTFYTYVTTLYTYGSTYLGALLPFVPKTIPTNSAELASLVIFVLVLFTTFKVVDYVRRMILFWVFLVIKLVAVLALVQLALYVYTYGVEKTLNDLGWVWGFVESMVESTAQQGSREWNNVRGNTARRQGTRKVHANRPTRGRWT